MEKHIYIWEVTIPIKIEYKFWQACTLLGIDICDTDEGLFYQGDPSACFCSYETMIRTGKQAIYADILVTCSDEDERRLYHKLVELDVYDTDMWLLDELEEDYE